MRPGRLVLISLLFVLLISCVVLGEDRSLIRQEQIQNEESVIEHHTSLSALNTANTTIKTTVVDDNNHNNASTTSVSEVVGKRTAGVLASDMDVRDETEKAVGSAAPAQTPSLLNEEEKEKNDDDEEEEKEKEEEREGEHFEKLSMGVLFLSMLIFLGGTFFRTLQHKIPLPYTVILFLYGIFVGAITQFIYSDVAEALGSIPPELLFYIFLPVLIFEGSYAMNIHALRRVIWQTLLLASVGLIINTALLGLVVKLFFSSWYTSFLLGSLLSATDPVAVVSLLKGLQVDKCVTAMVDGEAVMNDGTAIIIFTLLLPAAKMGEMADPVWKIILKCFQLSFLPLIIGPLFGFIQSFWLRRTADALTRACVTVSVTYVSYYVANSLIGASGVLTLFFEGVFLSYYYPSQFPGKEGSLIYSTWEFLVHLGNTLLFSLVGVILVADVFPTLEFIDIFLICGLYIAMLLSRLIMLEMLLPILNRVSSFQITQKTILLLVHAGLRGGVAATLALAVFQEDLKEGIPILKMTCGVVFLTLLINASTAEKVVKFLGFNSKEKYRCLRMKYGMNSIEHSRETTLNRLKRDTKYRNAEWIQVEKYLDKHIQNPYQDSIVLEDDDEKALNRLLMSAFKTAMWRQMDEQILSETVMIEVGRVLARKIEAGELFRLREMQFYHKVLQGPPVLLGEHRSKRLEQGKKHKKKNTADTVVINGNAGDENERNTNNNTTTMRNGGAAGKRGGETETGPFAVDMEELPIVVNIDERASSSGVDIPLDRNSSADELEVHKFKKPSVVAEDSNAIFLLPGEEEAEASATSLGAGPEDEMIDGLMDRLLPTWVSIMERFICGKGYFEWAHQRAQENAFMTLLAISKSFSALAKIKYKYTSNIQQARRVDRWMRQQLYDVNSAIRFFYKNFPKATRNIATRRVVLSLSNSLEDVVEELHYEDGFGCKVTESLVHLVQTLRNHMPAEWQQDTAGEKSEGDLVLRAVAATALGRGLQKVEMQAIVAMGLVRHFAEDDVITLPDNAFLIVIFGTMKALHSSWTTIAEHDSTQNFGDTIGLGGLLLPRVRLDQTRQWRVLSSEATALVIGFNSIRPFLMERNLRSVRALWRAVAEDVLLPFLHNMISIPKEEEEGRRERLIEMIMQGKPLIGPKSCNAYDLTSPFHLVFYMRGKDVTGLFGEHSHPQYLSDFYAAQLEWTDPSVVLYVVPVNVSTRGYVPWGSMGVGAPPLEHLQRRKEKTATKDETEASNASERASPSRTNSSSINAEDTQSQDSKGEKETTTITTTTTTGGSALHSKLNSVEDFSHFNAAIGISYKEEQGIHKALSCRATQILGFLMKGELPADDGSGDEDDEDEYSRSGGSPLYNLASNNNSWQLSPNQNQTNNQHHNIGPRRDSSIARLSATKASYMQYSETLVCILQDISQFVTPVPYVNTIFTEYAYYLDRLCVAAFRYVKYPYEEANVEHARDTTDNAIEYLLSFGVELSLLKRAARYLTATHRASFSPEALASIDEEGDAVDASFQAKVVSWSRASAFTHHFHLRRLIIEMNCFANRRFGAIKELLGYFVQIRPELRRTFTVEDLNAFVLRLEMEENDTMTIPRAE